uniref:Membrane magnesium transporter n=1 Tax=Rhodosorus marinus TaxID=101924 RepID=A0A7S2ZR21_9RHOD|mmetsp:Transcript_29364/g.113735  ORF Transcript_29364/g.113735 Transcript_29364/m.113735 type:complete len:107 (+) Transcript_29364:263-583(+)
MGMNEDLRRRIGGTIIVLSFLFLLHAGWIVLGSRESSGSEVPLSAVLECLVGMVVCLVGSMVYIDDFEKLEEDKSDTPKWYMERLVYRPDFAAYRHRGQALFSKDF